MVTVPSRGVAYFLPSFSANVMPSAEVRYSGLKEGEDTSKIILA
jgi:hypothetical protein